MSVITPRNTIAISQHVQQLWFPFQLFGDRAQDVESFRVGDEQDVKSFRLGEVQ